MATELGQPLTKQEEVQQHTPCTRILISSVRDLHQSQATCYNKAKLKSSCSIHRQTLSCTSIQTSLAYGILKTLNHTTRVYPCLLMKPGHFREKKKISLRTDFMTPYIRITTELDYFSQLKSDHSYNSQGMFLLKYFSASP